MIDNISLKLEPSQFNDDDGGGGKKGVPGRQNARLALVAVLHPNQLMSAASNSSTMDEPLIRNGLSNSIFFSKVHQHIETDLRRPRLRSLTIVFDCHFEREQMPSQTGEGLDHPKDTATFLGHHREHLIDECASA
jgi:hypothetical protein